jgi:hypothetical protein
VSRIKGKRPTVAQYKILDNNGYNTEEWLYVGTRHSDPNGNKSPSKNYDKVIEHHFVNKNTGESIYIEE